MDAHARRGLVQEWRTEFNLRRRADLKGNEVFLNGAEDVPEEFRKLVEEYYKSLSKTPKKQ